MNNINLKKEKENYKIGSIFKSPEGDTYILAQINIDEYIAISLDDGHCRGQPHFNKEGAVEGLDFVASDVKIIIEL